MCTVPGRIIKVIFEDPSPFCGPNLYLRPNHYLDPLRLKLNICDGEKVFRLSGNLLIGDNVRIINNLFSIAIEIDEKLKHGLSMDEKFQYNVMLRDSENIWAGYATNNISFEAYFAEISDKCSEYKLLGKL